MFRTTGLTKATLALALLGAVVLTCLAAAPPAARLTIADGPVQLLRGAARFEAFEGLALAAEDIVRTGALTRVARIEFADGRLLDLGPATQVLLLPAPPLEGSAAVLTQGWAKLGAGGDGLARLAAPGVKVEVGGSALLQAAPEGTLRVFAESRAARVLSRGGSADAFAAATLREGESWSREAGVHRALPQQVPRALADALPRRAARFESLEGAPESGEPLDAADLAPWLRAEPALMAQRRPSLAALARRSAAAAVPPRTAGATRRAAPIRVARPDPRQQRPSAVAVLHAAGLAPVSAWLDGIDLAPARAPLLAAERVGATPAPALAALPAVVPPPAAAASAPPARNGKKRVAN